MCYYIGNYENAKKYYIDALNMGGNKLNLSVDIEFNLGNVYYNLG